MTTALLFGTPRTIAIRALNAIGLRHIDEDVFFAAQTRIDSRALRLAGKARIGNVYVNRNIIGAVVGVQPFGGEGMSGTGPKAGGPNYLYRFCALPAIAVHASAAPASASAAVPAVPVAAAVAALAEGYEVWRERPLSERVALLRRAFEGQPEAGLAATRLVQAEHLLADKLLPGPTGESNELRQHGRGVLALQARVCRDLAFARTDIASLSFVDVASHLSAIVIADAASFHRERLASQPENVGAAIHSRIARGLTMTAVEYADHLRWMEGYQHEVAMTFRNVDFIIAPSVPVSPPLIVDCDNAVTATQMLSRNCWFAPGAGLPAITVPCGLDNNGIPVGLQIAGPRWSDLRLLALAQAILDGLPSIGRPAEFVNMGS